MLQCINLNKRYQRKQAVDNLNFTVQTGEAFALLGSNGAGKTTTIKMILGLVPKDSGEIIMDKDIQIGYSPETPYFPPFLTGRETLVYYAEIQKIPRKEIGQQVSSLLAEVGLEDSKTKVKYYSKGMLQRLALAQALIGNPALLILDEPTAGLDALGRLEIMELIHSFKEQGKTILINSHILSDIERVCDRGIIMKAGKTMGIWDKSKDYQGKELEELFVDIISRTISH